MLTFNYKISGIPCQIEVHSVNCVKGSYNAPSSADFYDTLETDYTILDRKGHYAAWLEGKLDNFKRSELEHEIVQRWFEGD